jgi:hypothetical protein
MKAALQLFRKHPATIIWFLLFTLFYIRLIGLMFDKNSVIHGPDGGLPFVFMCLMATIFVVINILNAVFRKSNKGFYLCISLIMIVEIVFVIYFGG